MSIINDIKESIAGNKVDETAIDIGTVRLMIRITESESYSSEVPSTMLEDGSIVNDHIIYNPLALVITGDVSDIYRAPSTFANVSDIIQSEIGAVDGYIPAKTQQQLSKIAAISNDLNDVNRAIQSAYEKGSNVLDSFGYKVDDETGEAIGIQNTRGRQKKFYDEIKKYWETGQKIQIKMPFETHENMIITSVDFNWDNEFDSTGVSITAQQIRFATSVVKDIDTPIVNPSQGTGGSTEGESNRGTNSTTTSTGKKFAQYVVDKADEYLSLNKG